MSSIWFTADTHFSHHNIIGYCSRPFETAAEMNEVMMENWNRLVRPGDLVWHLGDFEFARNREVVERRIRSLNGEIRLVWGNHDKRPVRSAKGFAWQGPYWELDVRGRHIVLMHYAMKVWNRSHHGSWQLYGHSHGTLKEGMDRLQMDVGVDANGFCPVSFDEVRVKMDKRKRIDAEA